MNSYRNIFEPPAPEPEIEVDWQDVLVGFMAAGLLFSVFCVCVFDMHLFMYALMHNFDANQVHDHLLDLVEKVTP